MKISYVAAVIAAMAATPGLAESDAAAGEKAFRQCQACHVVVNDAGETLAGRSAKTGPNLYGVAGRAAGSVADFKYSKAMIAAGEGGLNWNVDEFVAYVQDPSGYLKEFNGDPKARSNMAFKVRKEQDAKDLFAYFESLAPATN